MAVSLYDLSVTNYLQTLGAVEGFVAKSLTHFNDNKVDANEVADARLAPDMLPFRFQIHSTVHHSLGAIRGVQVRRVRAARAPCRRSTSPGCRSR